MRKFYGLLDWLLKNLNCLIGWHKMIFGTNPNSVPHGYIAHNYCLWCHKVTVEFVPTASPQQAAATATASKMYDNAPERYGFLVKNGVRTQIEVVEEPWLAEREIVIINASSSSTWTLQSSIEAELEPAFEEVLDLLARYGVASPDGGLSGIPAISLSSKLFSLFVRDGKLS